MSGIAEVLHESRLSRAGLGPAGERRDRAPRRSWARASSSATRAPTSTAPTSWSSRARCPPTTARSAPRSRSAFRSCRAPRCSASSCASATRSRSPARTARPRPRAWSRAFSPRAARIRPSSSAGSSRAPAATRASAPAAIWSPRPTRATASFTHLQPLIAIVTNIDNDHLATHGGDFELLKTSFVDFLHNLPFYGLAVLCVDDEHVRSILPRVGRPILTYGIARRRGRARGQAAPRRRRDAFPGANAPAAPPSRSPSICPARTTC